jgi:hypothetical protein
MNEGIIYLVTNTVSDKIYIGFKLYSIGGDYHRAEGQIGS